ncbi:MAG TPA: hypothetical protein GX521_05205 [Firmicutes bacterium]|nr:hypothetical protein [Bacillota bacterium]
MNKKKVICTLLSVILFNLIASAGAAARPTDVPVDHWAYHAVNTALSKNYLSVFEDGTFKGSGAVDRYTLANVIYLLLEEIQVAEIKKTSAELTEIRDLSLQLEKDLGLWYADREALQEELKKMREGAIAADERLSRVVESQQTTSAGQEKQIQDLQAQLAAVDFSIDEMLGTLKTMASQIQGHQASLGDKDELLDDLVDALLILDEQVYAHEIALQDLEGQLGNLAAEKTLGFAKLEAELAEQIAVMDGRNKELETNLRNLAALLKQETEKGKALALELAKTEGNLEAMEENINNLRHDKSAIEAINANIKAQVDSAFIREKRLESQIKELEEEFTAYRASAEKEIKSSKTLAMVAIAVGAIGAIIGASMGAGL